MKRNCAICGCAEKHLLFEQHFTVPSAHCVSFGYDVVVCQQCDFAYADNTLDQADLDAYYASGLKTAYYLNQRVSDKSSEFETQSDVTLHMHSLENVVRYAHPSDRILDVGCGSGHLLSMLQSRGYSNTFGVDPSSVCCRVATECYGLHVTQGSLFDSLDIGQYDFVILSHVLEHVENLAAFVMRLHETLRPGGRLYVEVPDVHQFGLCTQSNVELPWEFAKDLFAQFTPEHVNFFSSTALRNLMSRLGFREVWLEPQISIMGVLASVWEKPLPDRDHRVRACVEQYIHESQQLVAEPLGVINGLVQSGREFLVWGAGLHTQRLLACSNLAKANIRAFVDSNPAYRGLTLAGRPMILPEDLSNVPPLPILISSRRMQAEIERQIRGSGLENEILLMYSE